MEASGSPASFSSVPAHYGETEHRSIYGEAGPADARALMDEGIEVHPLPVIPDDRN